jgi:hypothetical protein
MTSEPPFTAEVTAYLADCAAHRGELDPKHHPTEDGALKLIPHRRHHDKTADKQAEDQIKAAYRAATGRGLAAVRQEAAQVNAPLERGVALTGPRGSVACPGGFQPLRGGGGGSPRLAQLVEVAPEAAVGVGLGHPVQPGIVQAVTPDQPVVVHQRDAGFLRHNRDASAAGARGELLAAALDCAARGWRVMPVRARSKKPPVFPGHKAAECTGRDPRCRGGHTGWESRATADPARVTRGWAEAGYNIGIATGPSGLIVVDLDQPKPGDVPPPRWALPGISDGADVLAALCEEHDEPFPWETLQVRTGRGGLHLYFTAPPGTDLRNTHGEQGGLGWLIDTRAHGGYVVAPGSAVDLPDGSVGRYELAYDRPPAPLPAWLAALLTAARPDSPSLEGRSPAHGQVRELDSYVRTALQGERERVASAAEGHRTWALNKAGYKLGRLIAAGVLPEQLAEDELLAAARVHFTADQPVTPAEARASVRGGIAAGKRHPRTVAA